MVAPNTSKSYGVISPRLVYKIHWSEIAHCCRAHLLGNVTKYGQNMCKSWVTNHHNQPVPVCHLLWHFYQSASISLHFHSKYTKINLYSLNTDKTKQKATEKKLLQPTQEIYNNTLYRHVNGPSSSMKDEWKSRIKIKSSSSVQIERNLVCKTHIRQKRR